MKRVFLDIETRALAADVGGWDALLRGEGGMSIAVTIEEPGNITRVWDDHTIEALAAYLEAADEVVTWNGFRFDIRVIESLLGRTLLLQDHRDLKMEFGEPLSLEKAGQRYVGRGKTGHGEDAPALATEGRWGELVQYCIDDVELTRDVYHATTQEGSECGIMGEEPTSE